jgi:hypothetical protein
MEVDTMADVIPLEAAETFEQARVVAFVAQTFAVRSSRRNDFDDIDAMLTAVRTALDDIDKMLPTGDEAVNYDLRKGAALLAQAADLVADHDDGRIPRSVRRRVVVLNALASDHMTLAIDRLRDRLLVADESSVSVKGA